MALNLGLVKIAGATIPSYGSRHSHKINLEYLKQGTSALEQWLYDSKIIVKKKLEELKEK